MDFLNINHCKVMFASITIPTVIIGLLVNLIEPHLPVSITRSFRYGKFASKEDSPLVQKFEVPKSTFRHFYSLAAFVFYPISTYQIIKVYWMEEPVSEWFMQILNICCGTNRTASVTSRAVFIANFLLTLQVLRRFYDTHFVSVFSQKATINIVHYIIGIIYYPLVMLALLSEAPKFSKTEFDSKLDFSGINIIEIVAIIIFLWAWYHQHVSNVILANVRKNKKGQVVSDSYKIPTGDWFKYLSSPHSSAEILMYTALTLILYKNSAWWYVYAWVLSNQVQTILMSHWWYQNTFKNFPKERKALIPFVY